MAGDWIKWGKGLASRREIVILASKLGRDRHEIAGRLMVLWEWCDENIPETDVDSVSLDVSLYVGDKPFEFFDALLGIPGFAESLASPEVRWMAARSEGRIVFPKFGRHNGITAKSRAYEARKKQRQRESVPVDVPKLSRSVRDKTGTREEKRREELKTTPKPSPKSTEGGCGVGGVLTNLCPEDLQNPAKLIEVVRSDGRWASDHGKQLVLAAAMKSLDKGKNPGGMFRRLIEGGPEELSKLVEAYMPQAAAKLRELRSGGPASPEAAKVGALLKVSGDPA